MENKQCPACGQQFLPRPQTPHQTYCSAPGCQRQRKKQWQRHKLQNDPDYQDNQRSAQHTSGGTLAGVASPTTLAAAFGVGAGHTTARCANKWAAICSASRAEALVSAGSSKLACPVIKSVTRRQTVGHNEGSTAKWRPKLSRVTCLTLPSIRSLATHQSIGERIRRWRCCGEVHRIYMSPTYRNVSQGAIPHR
jgi:hypothetical protein